MLVVVDIGAAKLVGGCRLARSRPICAAPTPTSTPPPPQPTFTVAGGEEFRGQTDRCVAAGAHWTAAVPETPARQQLRGAYLHQRRWITCLGARSQAKAAPAARRPHHSQCNHHFALLRKPELSRTFRSFYALSALVLLPPPSEESAARMARCEGRGREISSNVPLMSAWNLNNSGNQSAAEAKWFSLHVSSRLYRAEAIGRTRECTSDAHVCKWMAGRQPVLCRPVRVPANLLKAAASRRGAAKKSSSNERPPRLARPPAAS